MNNRLLHTPEGVRDIYNGEYARKKRLTGRLLSHLQSFGYAPIKTPTFEFFDIFSREVGTTPSAELYKFFDRDGHTLVLRPDFTPSVARAASKYFDVQKEAVRLCYEGDVFQNNLSLQGRLKESTQLGAELFNDSSVDGDAEIIAMVVKALLLSGLKEFQISIGHAKIFSSLVSAAGFDEDEEEEIRNLIFNHNSFGVEEFLTMKEVQGDLRKLFSLVLKMYTSPQDFSFAVSLAKEYPALQKALLYLNELHEVLKLYGVEDYVSFELGLISTYSYYTGIIFSGYTFGSGQPVVKGGRYDELLSYFKKDAPAIGFAIEIDSLLSALDRQHLSMAEEKSGTVIFYSEEKRAEAILAATRLRAAGQCVTLLKTHAEKETDVPKDTVKPGETVIVYL